MAALRAGMWTLAIFYLPATSWSSGAVEFQCALMTEDNQYLERVHPLAR